jgi:hypothetical protein
MRGEEGSMGADEKPDPEGIWADPEAILRPTEGERLKSIIQDFEDERYPEMMALGWSRLALERLPPNQMALKKLLDSSSWSWRTLCSPAI